MSNLTVESMKLAACATVGALLVPLMSPYSLTIMGGAFFGAASHGVLSLALKVAEWAARSPFFQSRPQLYSALCVGTAIAIVSVLPKIGIVAALFGNAIIYGVEKIAITYAIGSLTVKHLNARIRRAM